MKFILRSLAILLLLYGLVFAPGDAYLSRAHAPLWLAGAFAVGLIGLQFLIGPWLIEWLMAIVWDEDAVLLPAANREFVAQSSTGP
jgi:Zn-dependent protease with chaperone function